LDPAGGQDPKLLGPAGQPDLKLPSLVGRGTQCYWVLLGVGPIVIGIFWKQSGYGLEARLNSFWHKK